MSTAIRGTIKFADRLIDRVIMIICLILFLIGFYALYDSYMVYNSANDDKILKFKPGYESYEDMDEVIVGNMVAWLTIEDTPIDYPIMQGKDNVEYLNKDPFGKYAMSGSIFLDARNDPEFFDYYSLVYGHHMEHGMMFGALDLFLDEDFFNTHENGYLLINKEKYPFKIFALLETDASEKSVFAPTEEDDLTLPFILENATYLRSSAVPKKNQRIVGLSTCKYPDTTDRTLVFLTLQ